jgi:branched-chain amino acid transport system ATP-binding protein
MLAIGRALATNPRLLLLDEPMEGLAPIVVRELTVVIRDLVAAGTLGVVLVEQHAELALALSHRALVMERGRVVHAAESAALARDRPTLERLLGLVARQSKGSPT